MEASHLFVPDDILRMMCSNCDALVSCHIYVQTELIEQVGICRETEELLFDSLDSLHFVCGGCHGIHLVFLYSSSCDLKRNRTYSLLTRSDTFISEIFESLAMAWQVSEDVDPGMIEDLFYLKSGEFVLPQLILVVA